MMRATALLLLLISLNFASAARIVCYYAAWSSYHPGDYSIQPEDLDANMCTHINYAFVSITPEGGLTAMDPGLDIDQGGYTRVVGLKQQNPSLKVLLSIGGGNSPAQTFSQIAADPAKRAAMVGSARWFMETYGFDGIDMDWEVPQEGDRDNYATLMQEFKDDFNNNGWLVTAAVAADVGAGYDVGRLNQILDHINVMTYDFYGPWSSYTGQNSPLYASSVESDWERANLNLAAAMQLWIGAGASTDKLVAGLAFYGRSFALADSSNNGLHASITGPGEGGPVLNDPGTWIYSEFCTVRDTLDCRWDDEQKNPICLRGNMWLGIDDPDSITAKVEYIRNSGLGGAMIWTIDQDDIRGHCGQARPLLSIVKNNLG